VSDNVDQRFENDIHTYKILKVCSLKVLSVDKIKYLR